MQAKVHVLLLYTQIPVNFKIIFFLALYLMLTGCSGRVISKPVVFADAEEYMAGGVQAYSRAEWHKSQRLLNKALQLYQGVDHQQGILLCYINQAEVSLAMHDYTQSKLYLMRAESIAKYKPLQGYHARIILLYGLIALQQQRLTEAEHMLQDILPAFDQAALLSIPDTIQLAAIASRTRIAFLQRHHERLWTSRYANALTKADHKNIDREARLLRFQSSLLQQQGNDAEAELKSLQALALYKSKQSRKGIAATLLELARYYNRKQYWQVALDYFKRAKLVYHSLGDDGKVAWIDSTLIQVQGQIINQSGNSR